MGLSEAYVPGLSEAYVPGLSEAYAKTHCLKQPHFFDERNLRLKLKVKSRKMNFYTRRTGKLENKL